jgi:elongation factor G
MSGSSKGHPIFHLVVSAADGADDKRLQTALVEIAGQDPSVGINTQPQERLYSLEGRAESDLESVCDRLRDEYQLGINVGALKAVFLETIRKHAEAEGKYIRQTGGMGNYGHCKLRIDPSNPGKGYEFINDIRGGAVPNKYIKSIEKGVLGAMEMGILAGFPVVDVKVTLCDGSYHEGDSNEMAFKFAGSIAFKEAARKASPVVLELVMAVEIEVPEELTSAIRSEIQTHRGRVENRLTANGFSEIKAVVPLSELLASSSRGLAEFPMEFAGYEAVRDNGSSDENGSGVTANRPNDPRPGNRSAMARWAPEEER